MEPDPLSSSIFLIALLVIAYATGAESVTANLNRADMRARASAGDQRAQRLVRVIDDAGQILTSFMLLRTLMYIASGAAVMMMWRSGTIFWLLLGAVFAVWLGLALVQAVVRGVVLPRSQQVALSLSLPIALTLRLLRPLSGLLHVASRTFARDEENGPEESVFFTEDGLRLLMHVREDEDQLEETEREMMASILELEETIAREAMVPRIDMVALSVDTEFDTALAVINDVGHSRIPVYEGNVDRILGFLYAKDMLKSFQHGTPGQPIRDLLRPAYFVPATKKLNALFSEMQKQRIHIALVVDEYGGTAGLITIEDILEEIVGDIQDEYDAEEDEYVQSLGAQGYLLNARLDVDTLAELLTIEMPDENADTLGGMLYTLLGRVPQQGDSVVHEGWRFSVILLDGRRIEQVRAEPLEPQPADENATVSEQSSVQRSLTRFLSL